MAKKQEMHGMAIKKSTGDKIFDAANAILMILLCFVTLYPMWYVLCASFTENSYLVAHPGAIFWPHGFTVGSYKLAFSHPLILSGYLNILFVLAVSLPINIALTLFCGYFLASKNVLFKKPILFIIMFTMFFSGGMIPAYLNIRELGLYNSLWALILPGAVSAWNLLLARNFFMSIPEDLKESAYIDGATEVRTLLQIVLPLSMPIIATLALFYALGKWNTYSAALIYNPKAQYQTLQVVVRSMYSSLSSELSAMPLDDSYIPPTDVVRAATVIFTTVPILVVYPFLQKYFAKGMMVGSLKG